MPSHITILDRNGNETETHIINTIFKDIHCFSNTYLTTKNLIFKLKKGDIIYSLGPINATTLNSYNHRSRHHLLASDIHGDVIDKYNNYIVYNNSDKNNIVLGKIQDKYNLTNNPLIESYNTDGCHYHYDSKHMHTTCSSSSPCITDQTGSSPCHHPGAAAHCDCVACNCGSRKESVRCPIGMDCRCTSDGSMPQNCSTFGACLVNSDCDKGSSGFGYCGICTGQDGGQYPTGPNFPAEKLYLTPVDCPSHCYCLGQHCCLPGHC